MKVSIDSSVLAGIKKTCQESLFKYEVGGMFLGKADGDSYFVYKMITVPSTNRQRHSFDMDGDLATKLLNDEMSLSENMDFLGIWHSHVTGILEFSNADKYANQQLADLYSSLVSCVVTPVDDDKSLIMRVYLIGRMTEQVVMDYNF